MQPSKHILVIRFSAMGDVAMIVPVLKNALEQNPSLRVTVVSNAFFQPLFEGLERCHFFPAYLKEKHKGIGGIYRLYKELKSAYNFDAVADMHDVLRSRLLRFFFRLWLKPTAVIDKGRKEKKELARKENKILRQLATTHERYAAVLKSLSIDVLLKNEFPVLVKQPFPLAASPIFLAGRKIIGIAPFAQHEEKMYPIERMKNVVIALSGTGHTVLLFGAGGTEAQTLQQWADEIPSVHNMAGKFSFKEELAIISNLQLMISMDSANMHLASLYAVPVISIWGATHPFAGFYGWGQSIENIISINLFCRPCSVFGNKPCWRGDHACMRGISEAVIIDTIKNQIG